LNSGSDLKYDYSAYLVDATKFRVEIRDPYTGACAYCADVPVQSWFSADAQAMLNGTQPGYVTLAMNKGLVADVNGNSFGSMSSTIWDWIAVIADTLSFSQ
jgi:hypothetical protein